MIYFKFFIILLITAPALAQASHQIPEGKIIAEARIALYTLERPSSAQSVSVQKLADKICNALGVESKHCYYTLAASPINGGDQYLDMSVYSKTSF
ncbi:hypothetical protein [Enterobacter asburiae]|uniref:hypothetical protein n=1 Tax=Enterobacter asburiae TaxID=61645 RepID=UPI0021494DBA|nr:hypothetical protein [Enterobacter asburiae]UUR73851.1 hypothetical protein NQ230_07025 [Enterobacter asburiae]